MRVRRMKLDLIGSLNPEWQDLAAPSLGEADSSPSAQNDSQGWVSWHGHAY